VIPCKGGKATHYPGKRRKGSTSRLFKKKKDKNQLGTLPALPSFTFQKKEEVVHESCYMRASREKGDALTGILNEDILLPLQGKKRKESHDCLKALNRARKKKRP